ARSLENFDYGFEIRIVVCPGAALIGGRGVRDSQPVLRADLFVQQALVVLHEVGTARPRLVALGSKRKLILPHTLLAEQRSEARVGALRKKHVAVRERILRASLIAEDRHV